MKVLGFPVTSDHVGHLVAVAGAPLILAQGTVPSCKDPFHRGFPALSTLNTKFVELAPPEVISSLFAPCDQPELVAII